MAQHYAMTNNLLLPLSTIAMRKGPFWLVLRTYGPGKSILDKTWKVPPVKPDQ